MKPQRRRKDNRITHHGITEMEVRCDMTLGPFDTAARAADLKWGVDRLPELVSPAMADRWGKAMADLNAAIASIDPDKVAQKVNACLRGFAAMDAEATAAGHQLITPDAIEFVTADGKTGALLRDDAAWPAYRALRPGVRVYTIRELVNALDAYGQTVSAVKDAFPDATVTAVRKPTPLETELNDEVPF
jgi:hypothetical protein